MFAHRLLSLDVFRGIVVAAMILVNCPGNDFPYAPLRHSDWDGCTFADLVFPALLVVMGVSVTFSLGRGRERGRSRADLARQAARRAAVILALGLLSSWVASGPQSAFRLLGVLQRISLCYLAAALLFLRTPPAGQALGAFFCLGGYALLLLGVPAPGGVAGDLSPAGNLVSYWDRALLGAHLARPASDPEGLLSTIPALGTVLIGVLAGHWLRARRGHGRRSSGLLAAGAACAGAGGLLSEVLPFNKELWTPSYALASGGAALGALALCYWIIEVGGLRLGLRPFLVLGRNPLLSYFLSELFYGLQEFIRLPGAVEGNLKLWLSARLFGGLSAPAAALAYAVAYLALVVWLMGRLYRRKLFLRA